MRKLLLGSFFGMAFLLPAFGQITVASGMTPQQYVENVLIGSGVTVSNFSFTGQSGQIGSFNGVNSNIGFNDGIVLSSGLVNSIPGNAASIGDNQLGGGGDASLLTVAQSVTSNPAAANITSTQDVSILEFDFVPSSNLVNFNFVFASDEYLTWINSQYNDVFGFFVSGPGITGPFASPAGFPNGAINLALVPNTNTPITISTIHPNLNSAYYISNAGGNTHSFNGFTTPIPVEFSVECGQTYHFKFAVADCQDQVLNTAVFLEGGSFTSPPVNLSISTASGTNIVQEGCQDANIYFVRNECQSTDSLTVSYVLGGTATEGVDFNTLTNPILLLPGQDTAIINVQPLIDGLIEGNESITLTLTVVDVNGDTIIVTGTLLIEDGIPLDVSATNANSFCLGDSATMVASSTGGIGVVSYQWVNGPQTTDYTVSSNVNGSTQYMVIASDQCGGIDTAFATFTMNQTLVIDTLISYPSVGCDPPNGAVSAFVLGLTGQPQYTWTGPGNPGPNNIDATVMENIPSGWYYFTASDNVCSVNDSVFVTQESAPVAQLSASVTSGCDPLTVTFTNTSQDANNYAWTFGNGNNANVGDLSSQTQTYSNDATIQLIAFQGQCSDTAYVTVNVEICGCTDPSALNYNPDATQNDNSCVYPIPPTPTVVAPNVFTPNSDTENPMFVLTTTNAADIELTILNRWGNTVYTGKGINPAWDGKVNSTNAEEGVYFYKYIVTGVGGDKLEGHGFLHLIRD
jgi:gliding motility-associated-like protein